MNDALYSKELVCPVCKNKIEVTKVKSKACVVSSKDTDFCLYYEGINPILYEAWVCEYCGYAALGERFEELTDKQAQKIKTGISPYWKSRSFNGERNIDLALEAYKLALYNLQKIEAKSSELAKVCIRIAWLYRMKKDEREYDFLKHALRFYLDTYENEKFPVNKLDEYTCMYMIAELYRRTGNVDEAVLWFSRLITSPGAKENKVLVEYAREQYYLAKEQKENSKQIS
ncbi:DUF2225 domain-containing protein [Acetivibrio clariflavus]|uniref:DUF2225 domain-containing protein n=1 Tax=Acetivibrio clariflavus (strain DSM 19732 / NBRC 101661 / EBR45) TaxID=720554 RepID=G8M1B6_ACECE|nr:DUF2225 domain-containing protein [Acetivibrio clariflavus]AEV68092.1 hypothetical protein Clocl_1442 [Acetivibrio clariflavus DSM 19732]